MIANKSCMACHRIMRHILKYTLHSTNLQYAVIIRYEIFIPIVPFGMDKNKPSGVHSCSASSTIRDTSHSDTAVIM